LAYTVSLGMRGFQVDGKTGSAALMKTTRVYPLAGATNPPMTFEPVK
jgi:hypothetical protein